MQQYMSAMPSQRNAVKSEYHCATLVGNWEEERKGFGPQADGRDGNGGTSLFMGSTMLASGTSAGRNGEAAAAAAAVMSSSSSADASPSRIGRMPTTEKSKQGNTTYTVSYKAPPTTDANGEVICPPSSFVAEAPRELLFYHGDLAKPTEKNLMTMTELSYKHPHKDVAYTTEEMLDLTGVSERKDKTAALRRSMGFTAPSSSCSSKKGNGSLGGDEAAQNETTSSAIAKESAFIQSLRDGPSSPSINSASDSATSTKVDGEGERESDGEGGYVPPGLPPVGRVATRDAFLSTKNVTIDATGEYLYQNLQPYPLTSSVSVGKHMASKNDPMHKIHLRETYELTK